ncbi:MAG: nucleoside hydrolase [Clostridiales bacterium]|nr:nucleoside hydrolase [Clostridiales bacterium]
MKWKQLSHEELFSKLAPPTKKVSMVLDTDTYNEVDDQFALAYSLLSPEKLEVEAIYAAPFYNERSSDPKEGMEKSYTEILRLLRKMHRDTENFVFKGSDRYLPDENTAVDSPAARDLIDKAMSREKDDPLYVVAIGAITNVASAILLEPRIVNKIVVVWLGGQPLDFPTAKEFNLWQDVPAVRVVLDCGVPLVLVPCLGVASHMLATMPDLEAYLGGKNDLCDTLIELFGDYEENHFGWGKEIWDVAPIGYMINPDWVPTVLVHSPIITEDLHWAKDTRRHMIRIAYFANRTDIFTDMYHKLGNMK